MINLRTVLGLTLAFWLMAASAQDFVPVPKLTAHVVDVVGMLDANQRTTLENVLKDYEARSGGQIAILLVASTAPEAIEQYGIRVADAWKLGRKGVDDGVILLVARDNPKALRRLRIEAGRGIQGTVTDAQSKRILQDVIAPHFRQNDYYGGLAAGVSVLTTLMDQEHLPAPKRQAVDEINIGSLLPYLIFFVFAFGGILSRVFRSNNSLNSNGWGRTAGIIIGAALSSGRGGGFGGGGGGFNSGGGFSGGGGGFDGGGASGDW